MSIEQTLERIAVAVEKIAAGRGEPSVTIASVTQTTIPAVPIKIKKEKPMAVPAEKSEFDLPSGNADTTNEIPITFDQLKDRLTAHATNFGTKVTLPIMVRHGADAITPKMNTIPEANWKACLAEINADLKKQGK